MSTKRTPSVPAAPHAAPAGPRIGLALGAGGARGLCHIAMLEAFDDLGVKPAAIAGSSIGAIIGAAYAAGLTGKDLRQHVKQTFRNRAEVLARLFRARVGRLSDLFQRGGNPVLVDAETVLDLFWPDSVPDTFAELNMPFAAIATDYAARRAVVIETGPLVTAVAASMAIPGLVRPVNAGGRVYIDGGASDPLPYETLRERVDFVVAVDVTGGPDRDLIEGRIAEPGGGLAAALGAAQIMQNVIVAANVRNRPPDILIRPPVEMFRTLDFFAGPAILKAAEPARDDLKRQIEQALGRL